MSLDLDVLLKVIDACEQQEQPQQLISLVFPRRGGESTGQIFLEWKPGKLLRDYLKTGVLHGVLSTYQASHSRIVDHRGMHRRLTYVPQPGDEFRFVRASPVGAM